MKSPNIVEKNIEFIEMNNNEHKEEKINLKSESSSLIPNYKESEI